MIKVTYYKPGVAAISVNYAGINSLSEHVSPTRGWVTKHRNGAHIYWNEHDPRDSCVRTPVVIFDVDTVYDSRFDMVYYCHTPEAECALEIARGALK